MKKLFLIISAALLLLLTGCNPLVSGNGFDKLVRIKNFEKYTGLGVGNKNTARSARSLTTDYLTSCGLFGQNPDGTYELLIFEDEQGHEVTQSWNLNSFNSYDNFIFISMSESDTKLYDTFTINNEESNSDNYFFYCINSNDGKMYNIGNYFTYFEVEWSYCEPSVNAYIKGRHDKKYNSLFRLSFTNDNLLKIEELAKIKTGVKYYTDKFGNIVSNSFIIKAGESEPITFAEKNIINIGYNGYIYSNDEWVNENGEWETALFVPEGYYEYKNCAFVYLNYVLYKDEDITIVGHENSYVLTFDDDIRYHVEWFNPHWKSSVSINKYYIEIIPDKPSDTTILYVYDIKLNEIIRTYTLNECYEHLGSYSKCYKTRIELNNGDTDYPIGIIDSDGVLYTEEDVIPQEIYITPLN